MAVYYPVWDVTVQSPLEGGKKILLLNYFLNVFSHSPSGGVNGCVRPIFGKEI